MVIPPQSSEDINEDINRKLREEHKLAIQKRQEDLKRQKIERQQQIQKRKDDVLQAIDNDDIATIQKYQQDGVNLHFIFERGPRAQRKYDVPVLVHSAKMVKFMLDNISPIHPDWPDFAKQMVHHAIYDKNSEIPELLEIAKQNNIPLDLSLKDVTDARKLAPLIEAGADLQSFDFQKLYTEYDHAKNGYLRLGRDVDHWIDPKPEKAAEIREIIVPLVSRATELGYTLETKEGQEFKAYEYAFLAELAKERAEGQTFTGPLNDAIDVVAAVEQKKEEERLAKEAEAERQRLEKEAKIQATDRLHKLEKVLESAVAADDIKAAADCLAERVVVPVDSGTVYGNALWYASTWFAQKVRSAPMAELLIQHMDMSKPENVSFAEEMYTYAINRDGAKIDDLIASAQKHGISLQYAMKKAADNPNTALDVFTKLSQAGIDKQVFDFEKVAGAYYRQKDGYWCGREQDIWREPEEEKAFQTRKLMLDLIANGYAMDTFLRLSGKFSDELDKEKQYDSFSPEDKQLIADLQNDNVDEIRKAIGDGLLKQDIVDYLVDVPVKKGGFIGYYRETMLTFKNRNGKPATSFNEAEEYVVNNGIFSNIAKNARFKPTGFEKIVGKGFVDEYIVPLHFYFSDRVTNAVNMFKSFGPEYQKEVAKALAQKLTPTVLERKNGTKCLRVLTGVYEASNGECKDILRLTLLKYRVNGTNEERCHKADLLKNIMKKDKIKKDGTLKAIAQTSLTPLSRLNSLLRKYGKDLER